MPSRAVDRDRVDRELDAASELDSASEPRASESDEQGEEGDAAEVAEDATLPPRASFPVVFGFGFGFGGEARRARADTPAIGADPGAGAIRREGLVAARACVRSSSELSTTTPRPARSASTRAAARASGETGGVFFFRRVDARLCFFSRRRGEHLLFLLLFLSRRV